jgi:hypothetical protein
VACFAATGIAFILAATAVRAQDRPVPTGRDSASPSSQDGPDFLFGRPRGWASISGTWLFPRAGGDLFSFVKDRLTLDRSDFHSRGVSGALGISVTPRLDAVTAIEVNRHAVGSEYRDYVKPDRSPIAQTTRFDQSTLTAGIRFLPTGRGHEVSRYAFIPRRVTPYVGAGLNAVFYSFDQNGEFVDFVDLKIFSDAFTSSGWAAGPYAQAGADLQVWRRLFVNVDARYVWVHSNLGPDFEGFHGIDLAGFKGSTGISVIF